VRVRLLGVHLIGVRFMDMHLTGVYFIGVRLIGVHLIGVRLMRTSHSVHLIGVHLTRYIPRECAPHRYVPRGRTPHGRVPRGCVPSYWACTLLGVYLTKSPLVKLAVIILRRNWLESCPLPVASPERLPVTAVRVVRIHLADGDEVY
jgi:hypothetical protein